MEKISYKIIEEYFLSQGYKIIGEYKNANAYVLCEKINDGIKCYASYTNLKAGKSPIIWGKYNYSNLEHNLNIVLSKQKNSSKLISWKTIKKSNRNRCLLTLQCEVCGTVFTRILEDLIYKKYKCCNDCSKKLRGITKRSKNAKKYLEQHGYKILKGDDSYRKTDYFEVEDEDGFRGFLNYAQCKRGRSFSKFDVRINKKYYIYNVNNYAKKENIKVKCLDFCKTNYVRQGLKFRCSCGKEFITSIASFQNGKTRCDYCSKSISRLENIFREYLDSLKMKYIQQFSYNNCRDILPLPFDFYLIEKKTLVEIDGPGHYMPFHFNQMSYESAKKSFEIIKKHDKIKNNFCEANKINLIRLPYWLFNENDSYKDFFQEKLNRNEI